jgi:hypothetical protein
MRWSLLAVVVVSLSGCAIGAIAYRAPDTGPTALINYRNGSSKSLEIALYNQSQHCTGRRRLDIIEPGGERTAKVRAGEEVTFQYHLSGSRRYCLTNLRFTPRNGATYQFDTVDDADRCLWRMLDVSNEEPQRVELQKIPWHSVWDENSAFCSE